MASVSPHKQRAFALEVVRRLRREGYQSLLAGGCVRDQLLGLVPKDYDIATDAKPAEIRRIFSHRRTIAVGAAFGVIGVIGPPGAGQLEVTTFRRDAAYSDGRHPDAVSFSTPEEDAARRDFTINGLFYDPIRDEYLDFVGGRADLEAGIVRAIGDPRARFGEDKLRLLRAVRFAATYRFALEEETAAALRELAAELPVVSPERIAQEMRRLLAHAERSRGLAILAEVGLLRPVLPELADEPATAAWPARLATLERLPAGNFSLALAATLFAVPHPGCVPDGEARQRAVRKVESTAHRWRLSRSEAERAAWLVERQGELAASEAWPWSRLQPWLIAAGIEDLLALDAAAAGGPRQAPHVARLRALLARPAAELNPPPLVSGDDLLALGVPGGRIYRVLLDRVRAAQLDGELPDRAAALAALMEWSRQAGPERAAEE